MTKQDVNTFLTHCRDKLIDRNNKKMNYDAFILSIGGHGVNKGLICSDGKIYKYIDIRQIFLSHELFSGIPKLYLIDACRVNRDAQNEEKSNEPKGPTSTVASTFSVTLLPNSEGNVVRGAKIAKYFCDAFEKNYGKSKTLSNLICSDMQHAISKATNGQQTLVLNEMDPQILQVVFMPYIK